MTGAGSDLQGAGLFALAFPLLAGVPRLAAAMTFLNLLPKQVVPVYVRGGLVVSLTLFTYPMLAEAVLGVAWGPGSMVLFALKEVLIGAVLGYSLGLVVWVLGAAGELIDTQAGFNNAQIFDPFGGHSGGPFSALLMQFGILLFVGMGGFVVFLQFLYESYRLWPVASFVPDLGQAFRSHALSTSGSFLELAVRWAAPVIMALLVVELGIGLINRAASQLNAFYFALPIKAVGAVLVLALMLAHLVDVVRAEMSSAAAILPSLDRVWRAR